MSPSLLEILRCPVTRTALTLHPISMAGNNIDINEGILSAADNWIYPIIKGIPRLAVESFLDYEDFLRQHLPGYDEKKSILLQKHDKLIRDATNKNKRTKKSFTQEWKLFNYNSDKTWSRDGNALMKQFLEETDETAESLKGKVVFDVGCGNGVLDGEIARAGATVIAMDFSQSIERAHEQNTMAGVHFIQGDLQFPPVEFAKFDIVHASGVLIHTHNTEYSFGCIDPCTKQGGKLSVWLYHPRKNAIHQFFNFIRKGTSKLPVRVQYYLYAVTLLPPVYVAKRLKGNKQNTREMMIELLDWLSPEFRWEHTHAEAESWFVKRNYHAVKITTNGTFGFNIIGIKTKTAGR